MNIEIQIVQENRNVYNLQTLKEVQFLSNEYEEAHHVENENLNANAVLNLHLDIFKLEKLKDDWDLFSNIKLLNISCCGLTEIPNVTYSLKYLFELNLSNNSLESLPKELGDLCNLRTLKLSTNKLSSLPKSLRNAEHLNYLDLSCNNFDRVPDILFYSLWLLQVLDLSCNKLRDFNDPPACLYKLIVLGLSDNFLSHLPVWIFDNLCQLKYLDINKNPLHLETQIINYYCKAGVFETLQFLNIENCNLSNETIQVLFFFKNLKALHLGNKTLTNEKSRQNNYLGNLKIYIFNKIMHLYLQNAQIATLPPDLICLENIQVLDLSENFLSWLPECFCDLSNLESVNLTSNQLLYLPVDIGNLVNLKQIYLGNNKLCCIPDSFYNLCNLEYVDLYNNLIEKIHPSIFKGKSLKGIDLELNLLDISFCEYSVDVQEIEMLYTCFKLSFRKHFSCADIRRDLQMTKLEKNMDDICSDSNSLSTRFSISSFESEPLSDLEDILSSSAPQTYSEDENWEKKNTCQNVDEFFDPNEENKVQPSSTWKKEFRNNFCPAVYHAPSVMKTYVKNLASKNESVEEGQFDSD